MIRWATVTDVTAEGVWVVSAWLPGRTGPVPVSGSPAVGDPVLMLRTDEGELAAVRGGDTRYLPLTGGTLTGPLIIGGLKIWDNGGGFVRLDALGNNVRIYAGATALTVKYGSGTASYIEGGRGTISADPATSLVTKGYVDAVKGALAASSSFTDFQTRVAAL